MMIELAPRPLRSILCLGAHSDDLEIGCGATILMLAERFPQAQWHWVVLSASGRRKAEALDSMTAFLGPGAQVTSRLLDYRDGYFPSQHEALKDTFEVLKAETQPDLIFSHYGRDLHQDHRLVAELTWNTFRDHLILEYEIPKYDGGLGSPQCFVPASARLAQRKVEALLQHFPTQATKSWFTPDLFLGLMRLRGMECNAPEKYAEAFYARKLRLDWA